MPRQFSIHAAFLATLLLVACVAAPKSATNAPLPDAGNGRWGISVVALNGEAVVDIAANERFPPASTLKLVTTAAAMHYLGDFSNAGWPRGTSVELTSDRSSPYPNVVITGSGDASLSASPQCETNCLSELADAIMRTGVKDISTIYYDDSLFETAHWPAGWSHDDLKFAYGTAISALSVDAGVANATVAPGPIPLSPLQFEWSLAPALSVDLTGGATGGDTFALELKRRPGDKTALFEGSLPVTSPPVQLEFGLDDPAEFTARVLRQMIRLRGIDVHGGIERLDLPVDAPDHTDFLQLPTPDPAITLTAILHESSNFDSEVLLHHISLSLGDITQEKGLGLLEHILLEAGAGAATFNVADGSGLSVYNRMAPSSMTSLLVWAAQQDWFETWLAQLPVAASEGTLEHRLIADDLRGRVFAKSGSLYGTDGLAGYFDGYSGERYAFAIYIKDTSLSHPDARGSIDRLLSDFIRQN